MKIPYKELDTKIIPLVKFLNKNGIKTLQSCEGHKNTLGKCLVFPHLPWVEITRKSFYGHFNILEKSLTALHPIYGKIFFGSLDKKYNSYLKHWTYFIVFWKLKDIKYFMDEFKRYGQEIK